METKTLYHKRRWDAFAREWVYPENANKQFIKDLKEDDYMELARFMHNNYEVLAKVAGWKTQKKCQVKFDDLPEENKKVMYNMAIAIIQRNKEKADKLAGKEL